MIWFYSFVCDHLLKGRVFLQLADWQRLKQMLLKTAEHCDRFLYEPSNISVLLLAKPFSFRLSERIIFILGSDWPLSVKQIHLRIQKLGNSVSYQFVHKTIKQLEEAKILEKTFGGYCLDKSWLVNCQHWLELVVQNYGTKNSNFLSAEKGLSVASSSV